MLMQGPGIVLGQHCHLLNMGIRHVAQCKVNAPIASGNGHCRNRPLVGQFAHPVVVAACVSTVVACKAKPAAKSISPRSIPKSPAFLHTFFI